MRVAIDVTPLQTGHRFRGVGTYVFSLLSEYLAWERRNRYYLIAYPLPALPFSTPMPRNFEVVRLASPPLGRLSPLISHQVLLPIVLARLGVDVFHSPFVSRDISGPGIPAAQPVRTVVTIHDLIPLQFPAEMLHLRRKRWFYAWQLRVALRSAHILCDSHSSLTDIVGMLGCPPERVTSVLLGCDSAAGGSQGAEHQRRSPNDRPFILHVGGDFVNKNVETLLAAYQMLRAQNRIQHTLVLVGTYYRAYRGLCERFPDIAGDVLQLKDCPRSELIDLYKRASLFVFPSLYEGFGLPVLEAMSNGVPVITSNRSSLPEVAGDAAILVDPLDVEGLASAMGTLLTDEALCKRLRAKGLLRARELSWQKTANATLEVYGKVAENRGV